MKLIISESQFKRLVSEQVIGSYTPDNGTIHDKGPAVVKGVKNYIKNLGPHEVAFIAGAAASILIPPPGGIAVAMLIGALDAYQYKTEHNNKMASMTLMLAALPLIGGVVSKIPGVKQLGTKGMTLLADKMEKGVATLAPQEGVVAAAIRDNLPFIEREYQVWVKKTADTLAKKTVDKTRSKIVGNITGAAQDEYDYRNFIKSHPVEMGKEIYGKK